jgi:pyridoxine 5-phosphate synthase
MTKLSVNINKIATLRNSRGGNKPNVVQVALDCERFGADGITVHPRPDERHITYQDVLDLSRVLTTEFNIEGYPDDRFMQLIEQVRPAQATLVPDPPHVLTSSAGWDTIKNYAFLQDTIATLKGWNVRVSIFMETELQQIENAQKTGTDRIELYTGPYAEHFYEDRAEAVKHYVLAAKKASELGLGINAGHDLNLDNLRYFKDHVHGLLEVSIGHALISDALYFGLENTIQQYKFQLVD